MTRYDKKSNKHGTAKLQYVDKTLVAAKTITITTAGTPVPFVDFTESDFDAAMYTVDLTDTDGDHIAVLFAGRYEVSMVVEASASGDEKFEGEITVNKLSTGCDCYVTQVLDASGNSVTLFDTDVIDLDAGDKLRLQFDSDTNADAFTTHNIKLIARYLGA